MDFDGYYDIILKEPNRDVHLIGFSLGAMTAIHLAALMQGPIKKLTLIAPAAPLELGKFLPNMVGKPVFNVAKLGSVPFKVFTAIQRLSVSVAVDKVSRTMFAGSPKADMDLLSDPIFHEALKSGLRQSLGVENKAYRNAVLTYVNPWSYLLKDIKCPVTLHHGTLDNWAPIDMSYALQKAILTDVDLITYDGLGHYSTLHQAFPRI